MNRNRGIRSHNSVRAEQAYWRDNARFADLFNAVMFDGHAFIKAEDLEETSNFVQEACASGIRVAKHSQKLHTDFVIYVFTEDFAQSETQPVREVSMPSVKAERAKPVFSICLFFGGKSESDKLRLMEQMNLRPKGLSSSEKSHLFVVDAALEEYKFRNLQNRYLFKLMRILAEGAYSRQERRNVCLRYCAEHRIGRFTSELLHALTREESGGLWCEGSFVV